MVTDQGSNARCTVRPPTYYESIWPSDMRAAMIEAYKTTSVKKVATRFRVSNVLLGQYIKALGIPIHRVARHSLTCDYFADLATDEQGWALGLLATDGSVFGAKQLSQGVTIALKRADRETLETFRRLVGSSSPVTDYQNVRKGTVCLCSRLTLSSTELCEDLARLTVTRKKTWTVRPPEASDTVLRGFYRGCFDGDGGFFKVKKNRGGWRAEYVGNEAMVAGFATFIERAAAIPAGWFRATPAKGGQTLHSVVYSRIAHLKALCDFLYSGAPVSMARKHSLAMQILAHPLLGPGGILLSDNR